METAIRLILILAIGTQGVSGWVSAPCEMIASNAAATDQSREDQDAPLCPACGNICRFGPQGCICCDCSRPQREVPAAPVSESNGKHTEKIDSLAPSPVVVTACPLIADALINHAAAHLDLPTHHGLQPLLCVWLT